MRTVKRFAAVAAVVAAFGLAPPAFAAFDDYPAGESCAFPLRVEFSDGPGLKIHELVDRNGNDVLVFTGSSPLLVVSNLDSGESITFESKGQRL